MEAGAGGVTVDKSTRALFNSRKQQVLQHADLSRKGSIDDYIQPLVEFINSSHDYVTTSSCSGRILIYCEVLTLLVLYPPRVLLILVIFHHCGEC